jgi:hypothetical protein
METVIPLVMMLVEEAIKVEPAVATELATLFAKGAPTPADWLAYKTRNTADTFETLAPAAAANLPLEITGSPAIALNDAASATAAENAAAAVTVQGVTVQGVTGPGTVTPAASLHPIFGTPITPQ